MNKPCYRCQSERPVEDFTRDSAKADGRKSICKSCDREKAREYYAANRERRREYYLANRERKIAQVKAWQAANPERVRVLHQSRKDQA